MEFAQNQTHIAAEQKYKMNNVKKCMFVCFVLVLISLAGCSQQGEWQKVEIYKGTNELDVSVMKSAPPDEVYEDEPFKIVSKVSNKGAYQIENGILTLGYERAFIDLTSSRKSVSISLEGKSPSNVWDDEEIITFDLRSKYLDKNSEIHTTTLLLTSCYDYETIATFSVCIDTNIFETRPKDTTCTVTDKTSSGQGAPVAVTRVEEDISGGDYITPHFTIYIQNRGRGYVMEYGNRDACTSKGIGKDNFNVVNLYDVELGEFSLRKGDLRCSPELIKLRDNEAKIRCSLERNTIKSTDPSYITSLKVHLQYGYTRTDSIEMNILNDQSKG